MELPSSPVVSRLQNYHLHYLAPYLCDMWRNQPSFQWHNRAQQIPHSSMSALRLTVGSVFFCGSGHVWRLWWLNLKTVLIMQFTNELSELSLWCHFLLLWPRMCSPLPLRHETQGRSVPAIKKWLKLLHLKAGTWLRGNSRGEDSSMVKYECVWTMSLGKVLDGSCWCHLVAVGWNLWNKTLLTHRVMRGHMDL